MKMFFKRKEKNKIDINIIKEINDLILPGSINNKYPDYLKIDDLFFSGLFVIEFPRNINNSIFENILYKEENINYSIFFEKLSNYEVIKKITQNIGLLSANLKINSQNKQDYDVIETSHNDAKYIRRELQLNNEKIYNVYMYLFIYETSLKNLKNKVLKIQNILNSIGFYSKSTNFRNLELYKSSLPLNQNCKILSQSSRKSILTKPLSNIYPFICNNIFDETGILFGINQKELIIIDRFQKLKYLNANMLVLGMSGAGKSYFVKLQILRNSILNIKQLVIDPEGEYLSICKEIKGEYITLNKENSLNIFDLFYYEDDEYSILKEKVQTLNLFFELIIDDMTYEEKSILEDYIIDCYKDKNITFDNKSIEKLVNKNLINNDIDQNDVPNIEDLYNKLIFDTKCNRISNIIKPFVMGSMSDFNNRKRPNLKNKLIVIDIHNIKDEYLNIYLFLIIEFYWNIIKSERNLKKIIYIDEIWRLLKSNKKVAEFLILIFKTIRKYNGAATAITQDISDLLINQNVYGKAIINNSYFKLIFKIDEENINEISKIIHLNEYEKSIFFKINRGECLLMVNKNNMTIKVISNNYEKNILEGDFK